LTLLETLSAVNWTTVQPALDDASSERKSNLRDARTSADFDADQPVSRLHLVQYLGCYGYPTYCGGAGWGHIQHGDAEGGRRRQGG
jgi:hypothetical protein